MNEQSVMWQTATAVVQAVCSITLLAWYVLAAHLARRQARRERAEAFESLVRLCRDLGGEAKTKTGRHLDAIRAGDGDPRQALAAWKADMAVIYVCLDVVPHYEVRSPAFSQALTRLWFEVDVKAIQPDLFADTRQWVAFLTCKYERICAEVDAMAAVLTPGRQATRDDDRPEPAALPRPPTRPAWATAR